MKPCRILIAGIGNIFLGDDAFGVEAAAQLARRKLPDGVRVVDFGIRGMDLTYALLDDCDAAILIDAVPRGEAPGTLYVIEPDIPEPSLDPADGESMIDMHNLDPVKVLRLVAAMGGRLDALLLVGCEPTPFDPEVDFDMAMSAPVAAAIPEAVALVESLIPKMLSNLCNPMDLSFAKGDVRHENVESTPPLGARAHP